MYMLNPLVVLDDIFREVKSTGVPFMKLQFNYKVKFSE
jgi:hypothetical protein